MRYYCTPVRMASIKKSANNTCLEKIWRKGNPLSLLVRMQIDTVTVETIWIFLKRLEIKLPYDPTILLLGLYLQETIIEKDTYPSVHHSYDMEAT